MRTPLLGNSDAADAVNDTDHPVAAISRVSPTCGQTQHSSGTHQCLHSRWPWLYDSARTLNTRCTTIHCTLRSVQACHRCPDPECWTSSRWRFVLDEPERQERHLHLRWIQTRSDGTCQPLDPRRMMNIRPNTTVRCLYWSEHTCMHVAFRSRLRLNSLTTQKQTARRWLLFNKNRVVCLSVTFVHLILRRLKFSSMCLRHLAPWPSLDIQVKFYGDRPGGTIPTGELNTRGVAEYSDFWPMKRYISWQRCKTGSKLVLIGSRIWAFDWY